MDSVKDYAIFMLDPSGHVVSWNAGARANTGYEAAEIVGQHFSVFYPDEVRASGFPDRELEEARTVGRFEDEGWRLRKDGTRFWANVVISATFDAGGVLKGFAKVTRDLTKKRRVAALETEAGASRSSWRGWAMSCATPLRPSPPRQRSSAAVRPTRPWRAWPASSGGRRAS